jgi:hypothetical protein
MKQAEIEIPETWDTIKYEKPINPTCSRGMFGSTLYNNNKYHCYGVLHIKPHYDLTPYRATGYGFGEKSLRYMPLTHVHDRTKPKPLRPVNKKSKTKEAYEIALEHFRARYRIEDPAPKNIPDSVIRERNSRDFRLLANGVVGQTRYRTHQVNLMVGRYSKDF